MTSHNSFFGWIHSFKINQNNVIRGVCQVADTPYPTIIANPTLNQAARNWNTADTGLVVCFSVASAIFGHSGIRKYGFHSLMARRSAFIGSVSLTVFLSFFLAIRNSIYRLQGLVPNGLKGNDVYEPVKYNYAGDMLRRSFWSLIVEETKKPTV